LGVNVNEMTARLGKQAEPGWGSKKTKRGREGGSESERERERERNELKNLITVRRENNYPFLP
jgi:hypothetical protein